MPVRSTFTRYSLVVAAAAVLVALLYLQFADHLPDGMRVSNVTSLREQHPACAMKEVPSDHLLVAASVWEGGIPTDIVIGTPPHVATVVRVAVAPGDKPLTVFLSGYGVIWDFRGETGRVKRIVASSPPDDRKVAVRGIAADLVEFPVLRDCRLLADAAPDDEERRRQALQVMFGRRLDNAVYQTKASHVALPAVAFGVRPGQETSNDAPTPRQLDPKAIISAVVLARPELLPGVAGLKQLEAAGAIRKPNLEEVEEFVVGASLPYRSKLSPDFRLAAKFDYVITREVTLPQPPPMADWRFLVPAGVPSPRNAARVCVAQMDGFLVNNVGSCLREAREGIERLRRLPPVDKVPNCQILKPPEQASLEAVAAYEPEGANRGFREKPTPHPIEVRVVKAGDVVLVLSTYEPAIWRVSPSAGARIAGVLLIGYHTSTVEGIDPETPVARADHQGRNDRPKPPQNCTQLQSWIGGAYRGGPDALALDVQVLALTGRKLDGLRGAYRLRTATVD